MSSATKDRVTYMTDSKANANSPEICRLSEAAGISSLNGPPWSASGETVDDLCPAAVFLAENRHGPRSSHSRAPNFVGTNFDQGSFDRGQKGHGANMNVGLEINVALWLMIGCVTEKAVQFVQYLN